MHDHPRAPLCECGCGNPTKPYNQSHPSVGIRKGEYARFLHGHNVRSAPRRKGLIDERFYEIADCGYVTPCWVWTSWRTSQGYGRVSVDGKAVQAHHAVWEERIGPRPRDLYADHLCRNPPCVNPAHIEWVTPSTNARRSINAKLADEDCREILRRWRSGETKTRLKGDYGVVHATITKAINRGLHLETSP